MILEHMGSPVVKTIETRMRAMMAMHIESTAPGNLRECSDTKIWYQTSALLAAVPIYLKTGGQILCYRSENKEGTSCLT